MSDLIRPPLFDAVTPRLAVKLTIPGAPRTKKTSNRIVRMGKFTKILPSKAFMDYQATVTKTMHNTLLPLRSKLPLSTPVSCRALIYRDADRGDLIGYLQGLSDVLQHLGVIENDVLIKSYDGSRLLKDAANPRVEVVLEEMR